MTQQIAMPSMPSYNELVNDTDAPLRYERVEGGLRMKEHFHPVSITEEEANLLICYIIQYNVQYAYELATGVGISSLAIGLGLKQTNGLLLSVDAYIEEQYNHCFGYLGKNETYKNADGYKSAEYLHKKYAVDSHVKLEVGWSPQDIPALVEKTFQHKIQMAFIDGQHIEEFIIGDVSAVLPYLDTTPLVFFHDAHTLTDGSRAYLQETFNALPQIISPEPGGFNLAVINLHTA